MIFDKGRGNTILFKTLLTKKRRIYRCVKTVRIPEQEKSLNNLKEKIKGDEVG